MPRYTKAQAQEILAKLKAIDPVAVFFDRASSTQKAILASNTIYRLATSGNQGGKTATAVVECASLARGNNPYKPWYGPVNICVFVPSRAQASGVWGDRLIKASDIRIEIDVSGKSVNLAKQPLIPEHEIESIVWAYSPQGKYPGFIQLKNKSTIRIALSGDKKSWERVQGFPFDMIYRDEAVGNENLGAELFPRLAAAQTAVQQGKRPWGGGIVWVATETLVNDEFRAYLENCLKGAPDYQLFYIDPSENPAVSMDVRARMHAAMSDTAGDSMATLRMYGKGSAVDSLVIYPAFSYERHVVKDYEPDVMDNIWLGWDPGIRDEFGLMFFCINQERPTTLRITDFFHERGKTLDVQAKIVANYLKGRSLEGIITDPQANKRDYNRGKSQIAQFTEILFEQLKIESRRGILMGRNIIQDGVAAVKRYLDPDPDDPKAEPLLLINERALYVAQMLARARLKTGANALAYNTIDGKNLEVFDLTRYIVSRQPFYCRREPNVERWHALTATALPRIPVRPDPFAIRPDMTEDERTHVIRLRESTRNMEDLFGASGPGGRQMSTGLLPF